MKRGDGKSKDNGFGASTREAGPKGAAGNRPPGTALRARHPSRHARTGRLPLTTPWAGSWAGDAGHDVLPVRLAGGRRAAALPDARGSARPLRRAPIQALHQAGPAHSHRRRGAAHHARHRGQQRQAVTQAAHGQGRRGGRGRCAVRRAGWRQGARRDGGGSAEQGLQAVLRLGGQVLGGGRRIGRA
jgi:hypothetical protein